MEIKGDYATAIVYASVIDQSSIDQIQTIVNQSFLEGELVRIMPDCHPGVGCVIGYVQTLKNGKICPNLVGVDLYCGMLTIELGKVDIDLPKFDEIVNKVILTGRNIHTKAIATYPELKELRCYHYLNNPDDFFNRAIGTLGGGNHFIELDKDDEDNVYLVIHSGSRNLGKQVAEYYQSLANDCCNTDFNYKSKADEIVAKLKSENRTKDINEELAKLKTQYREIKNKVPYNLAWLDGKYRDDYLYDVGIIKEYAGLNRKTMAKQILKSYFNNSDFPMTETLHNYVDLDNMILRKGAIEATPNQISIIPINMKDGSLLVRGKSNPDYLNSAPHGAGRLMSRNKAISSLDMDEFKKSMKDVYSTSVDKSTIDESPKAYKSIDDILPYLVDTVDVIKRIKSIYNFKAKNDEIRYKK